MGRLDKSFDPAVSAKLSAADKGEIAALYDLGLCYSTGNGVDLDYVEAHKWFSLAALNGVKRAIADRQDLAQDMSQHEIAEAQRQARSWLEAHSDLVRH